MLCQCQDFFAPPFQRTLNADGRSLDLARSSFRPLAPPRAADWVASRDRIDDIQLLKDRFDGLMGQVRDQFLHVIAGRSPDKAVEAVLEHLRVEEERQRFYGFFRELSDIYEILSPDAFLRPFLEDYETLSRMFRILREAFEPGVWVDRELARKTARLVQKHTASGAIKAGLDIYEINEETLRKIEESGASDTEKVFNLLKSIQKVVQKEGVESPYLISIGEKAEMISQLFLERQRTTRQTLEELKRQIDRINAARKAQAERRMQWEVFSIFWVLKDEGVAEPEEKANQMRDVLESNPHWKRSEHHARTVRRAVYAVLAKAGLPSGRTKELARKLMRVLGGDTG